MLFYSILLFFILFFSILLYSTPMQVTTSQRGTHLKGPMEHGRKALKRKRPLPIDTDAQHKYDQVEQTHVTLIDDIMRILIGIRSFQGARLRCWNSNYRLGE